MCIVNNEFKVNNINILNEKIIKMFSIFNVILFCDKNQRINPEIDNFELNNYINKADTTFKFDKITLDANYRLGNDLEKFYNSIIVKHKNIKSLQKHKYTTIPKSYEFIITDDILYFDYEFQNDKQNIKLIITIQEADKDITLNEDIKNITCEFANSHTLNREEALYNFEIVNNYIFSSYNLMSKEMDSIYILLPPTFEWNNNKIIFNELNNLSIDRSNEINYAQNQLYVLVTRTRKKFLFIKKINLP